MPHPHQGLIHIFLHIRTGILLCLQYLEYTVVFRAVGQSAHHGHCLHTVVGGSLIRRVAVGIAVPTIVEGPAYLLHLPFIVGRVALVSRQPCHVDCRLQGQIVPRSQYQTHVHIRPPVAPGPSTLPLAGQPVVIERPQGEVAAYGRIHILHRLLVARVHIVVPASVGADSGERLRRQFLVPVPRGDGRKQRTVLLLPVCQLADSLAHQQVGTRRELVETLSHQDGDITPPLRPFAVRTVKVVVAHVHV